ncbi:hypothetical protein FMV2238Y02_24670 [Streptococcus canis]|uniref:Transposase n=1 Tax=Streptococcus canis TaxID=1329 RepID=A0A3P5XT52_STRCB|nr:hypothetical protein FMV2238Y02_23200 [Streptococcus canis]VDC44025.1 hypothetical protein FMV2238Y02_24670 [Streptococcus canis]
MTIRLNDLGQVYLVCGKNGKLAWPRNSDEVKCLTAEQVDWLMKGFSISPNIKISKSRDFY